MMLEVGAGEKLSNANRDVRSFRLPIFRGSRMVASYNVAISDAELRNGGFRWPGEEPFMWGLARASLPHVGVLIDRSRIPRADDFVYEIRVSVEDLVKRFHLDRPCFQSRMG